ncbi:MAG: peptide chain release factor N(5)-glutamine methyltransferase [Desulfuromonas sp.]|nr:MAG: peptide chain release factor N(5)-glutamine methyltransferase [Desulfuromonas sp.]
MTEIWTLLKLLRWATDFFSGKGIDSPRLNAELLLAHALKLDRVGLYMNYDRPLNAEELDLIRPLVKRRAQREPLQYLIGETEFWSLPFKVTPDVLIPRADTEILVEEALARAGENGRLLDVGCGSGAIVVSLASELPGWQLEGLDISPVALTIASENAMANGVAGQILFRNGDLAELPRESYDLIVSNPPYIAAAEWETLMPEVRCYEPRLALVAVDEGLVCYCQLAAQASERLNPGGWLLVEIGYQQGDAVREIFSAAGLQEIFLREDYAGQPRVVGGQRKK